MTANIDVKFIFDNFIKNHYKYFNDEIRLQTKFKKKNMKKV